MSVIIATYTRAQLLADCLQHLSRQRFQPGDEVLVVDNGSTDQTQQVVRDLESRFSVPLRLLYEATPGKSHALARALSVATGDVLAFLDDDVTVEPDWLEVVRATMADPEIALMGGRVVPRWESSVPEWMRIAPLQHARLGAPLGLLDYPKDVEQLGGRTVLGANMAVRRDVFEAVGGFATHLGKLRGTLLSGEDHELCLRVQRAGFRAVYVPPTTARRCCANRCAPCRC
jgi:GT2 family glycosyltransferase